MPVWKQLENPNLQFPEILYSDRNLETEKNDRSRFSGKILTCYEVGPNGVILHFQKILLLFFAANNLN